MCSVISPHAPPPLEADLVTPEMIEAALAAERGLVLFERIPRESVHTISIGVNPAGHPLAGRVFAPAPGGRSAGRAAVRA